MRLLLFLVACSLTAAEPWSGTVPASPTARDDHAVIVASDGTPLELTVHYPASGDGPWPVVVFSHGLGGSRSGYTFLGQHWAAHGYVSIHLTHPGSDSSLLKVTPPAAIPEALRAATTDLTIVTSRPRQITTVIDALDDIERQIPALAQHLDHTRVAVAGHSYGAFTTLMVAGAKIDLPGKPDSTFSDPRPRCFLALSPQGTGPAFDRQSWDAIDRPVLVMTGSLDVQPRFLSGDGQEKNGLWRTEPFQFMPAGDKWLAWIDGARHSTFSGGAGAKLSGEAGPDPRHFPWVQAMTLAFLDAQLRSDAAAKQWLAESAAKLYAPDVRVDRR